MKAPTEDCATLVLLGREPHRRTALFRAITERQTARHPGDWDTRGDADIVVRTGGEPVLIRTDPPSLFGRPAPALAGRVLRPRTCRFAILDSSEPDAPPDPDRPVSVIVIVPALPRPEDQDHFGALAGGLLQRVTQGLRACVIALDGTLDALDPDAPLVDARHAWDVVARDGRSTDTADPARALAEAWRQQAHRIDAAWDHQVTGLVTRMQALGVTAAAIPVDTGVYNDPAITAPFNIAALVHLATTPPRRGPAAFLSTAAGRFRGAAQ